MSGTVLKPVYPKIQGRFNISQGNPKLFLSDFIIPITNADELLKTSNSTVVGALSITSAAEYTLVTVPEGKRLYLKNVFMNRSSGTYVYTYLRILRSGSTLCNLWFDGTGVTTKTYMPTMPIILEYGDVLKVGVGGFSGAGNTEYDVLYDEESTR